MTNFRSWAALIVILGVASLTASFAAAPPAQDVPIMVTPADLKWGEASPALPPGSKAAVVLGDPKIEGPFVIRVKLPADYKVAPHFHPGNEQLTVISGTLHAAMGDTFDPSKAKALPAGSFMLLPAKSPHFILTKEETVVQVSAVGPLMVSYVNPADDPRNKK